MKIIVNQDAKIINGDLAGKIGRLIGCMGNKVYIRVDNYCIIETYVDNILQSKG